LGGKPAVKAVDEQRTILEIAMASASFPLRLSIACLVGALFAASPAFGQTGEPLAMNPTQPSPAVASRILVLSGEEIGKHLGKRVVVLGVYQSGPLTGQAAVRLADGTLVPLGTPGEEKALRAADELATFGGNEVAATGVLLVPIRPPELQDIAPETASPYVRNAYMATYTV